MNNVFDDNRNKIQSAREFAHAGHDAIGQVRKYTGEPYWVHTDEVSDIVAASFYGVILPDWGYSVEQIVDICAANMHDILEDVAPKIPNGYNYPAIEFLFGRDVAFRVNELTDVFTSENYPKRNRAWRKNAEADRLAAVSNNAKTIKLADLKSNTKSIVDNDPDFAITYLKEKHRVMQSLVGGNPVLYAEVQKQLQENIDKLNVIV